MQREILFKAKRSSNGEWVTGYYAVIDGKSLIIAKLPEEFCNLDDGHMAHGNEVIEVVPETVCQYTGMCDINGTQIFENDIVRILKYDKFRKKICFDEFPVVDNIAEAEVDRVVGWCATQYPEAGFTDPLNESEVPKCEMEVVGNAMDDSEEKGE